MTSTPLSSSASASASASSAPVSASSAAAGDGVSEGVDSIKVFDEYGREGLVTRQQWLDDVLLGKLESHSDDPDALYDVLAGALKDGFSSELIPYAEQLSAIDPLPWRGATLLARIYLEKKRLDDAEQVLEEYIEQHGEEGRVLTQLARVYSLRGEEERAGEILWHALELDPNQDDGLIWFAAINRERGGAAAELEAFREVAELPGSWRARLWLARHALGNNDLPEAKARYREALEEAGEPTPSDLLVQMSGDLGNAGHLEELVHLAESYYDPAAHGIEAGNNFLKANIELGRLSAAGSLLEELYAAGRPDWKTTLAFWETELAKVEAKAETARREVKREEAEPAITALSIEGPIWMRHGAPFSALLRPKGASAPRFTVFGSTVVGNGDGEGSLQLSDAAGRLSRSLPLLLAEVIQIASEAVGVAVIPWAQGEGFALFFRPFEDAALCLMSGSGEDAPDYVIGVTVEVGSPRWQLLTRLIRREDGERLAEIKVELDGENPGAAVYQVCADLSRLMAAHAGVSMAAAPSWYQLPVGNFVADYLVRLEQLLTVSCQTLNFLEGGGLHGEREILEGVLRLCVDQPKNSVVRMLYTQTLRVMNRVRPELVGPYREKTARLWRDYPMNNELEPLVFDALEEVFGE
ncbi:hypothetical protein [Geomonas sp.]|uniref:tetratricopeptide repeat protein n=1 Tax=Geomonas sp. TaxID=2651584 RepID=UPI002B49993A|nr:hypothetical protein [Geomonas sp.]HJV36487.1 hypothetical protein [Geomonas sp.]